MPRGRRRPLSRYCGIVRKVSGKGVSIPGCVEVSAAGHCGALGPQFAHLCSGWLPPSRPLGTNDLGALWLMSASSQCWVALALLGNLSMQPCRRGDAGLQQCVALNFDPRTEGAAPGQSPGPSHLTAQHEGWAPALPACHCPLLFPCAGFLDWVPKKMQRVGCVELLNTVQRRVQPRLHVFGHIHEGQQ